MKINRLSLIFFCNIYLRCKIFIVQLASGRWWKSVHTYSIDRWVVFFLRLFSVRLGLHASYQIIDRRNLEIESHTEYFKFKSPIDEDLLDLGVLLLQLLLHQDLFLVFHLAVLRDGGVAVELQLVVDVLRLAWLVVSVLFEVVVGKGHLAELLLMGGGL